MVAGVAAPAWTAHAGGVAQVLVEHEAAKPDKTDTAKVKPEAAKAELGTAQAETEGAPAEPETGLAEPGTGLAELGTAQVEPGTAQVEPETGLAETGPALVGAETARAEPGIAEGEPDTAQPEAGMAEVEAWLAELASGVAQEETGAGPSPAARVAEWIAASGDNDSLPYMIIDKNSASLFLFDADGVPLTDAPVLIGIAVGDDATPGVGSKDLAEIGPAERTTPAGRFLAKYGLAAGGEMVLWVDYADSVALHPIPPTASKKERRRERMLSPTSDDNRITFGCINVPRALYTKTIRPLFEEQGGYVYVLPDTRPLEEVFPRLVIQSAMTGKVPR